MTYNFFRHGGIGALARAKNSVSLVQCTFHIKYKDNVQADFSLQCKTHVHGFTEPQPFILIYGADNLLPATTTCMVAKRTLGQAETAHIARNQPPDVRALSLHLKVPCAILCPDIPGSIAPKSSHEIAFAQLVDLAKTLEIEILFDWKWLHPDQLGSFLTIISQPETLRGFPVDDKNLRGRRVENWSVFSPTDPLAPTDPPSYADANHKRPRQVSSSPLSSPPSKRVYFIPEGSPTEKATTITNPPGQPFSTVDESLHAQPPHVSPDLENTVRKIIQNIFPDMLAQFLDKSPSISASPPPSEPKPTGTPTIRIPPSPRDLRSLRTLLSARAAAYCEQKLVAICENTVYDAQYLRGAADEEFIEAVEEQKFEIQVKTDEALVQLQDDIDRIAEDKLHELDATVAAYVEEAMEQAERTMNRKLETFLSRKWTHEASHATEASHQKPDRDGYTAGDRRRFRFRRRVGQR